MSIFKNIEKKAATTFLLAAIIFFFVLENYDHSQLFSTRIDIAKQSSYTMIVNNTYRIYINLEEMNLYLFNDEVVEKIYPISGGKPSTPSPIGEWIVVEKSDWGEGFGGYWIGLNVPWGT